MQLAVVSSGPQLLLSCSSLLLCFRSKNEFIIEICKVEHLKKKCLVESEIILHNSSFSHSTSSTQGCEYKIIVEMLESSLKNKF